jgi:alpha-methylacyl-CoA racemase
LITSAPRSARISAASGGEPQFYAELLERLGLGSELLEEQSDPATWPEGKARLAGVFKTKPLDEWCALLEGTNTCFAPVLTLAEAPAHPHNVTRRTFAEVDGVVQPAPAPRFSRTPAALPTPPAAAGRHTTEVLLEWGFSRAEVDLPAWWVKRNDGRDDRNTSRRHRGDRGVLGRGQGRPPGRGGLLVLRR